MTTILPNDASATIDYDAVAGAFNQALLHTLRKHSIADSFLDYWVPDADPVLGILSMIDSARIAGRTAITIRFKRSTVPEDRIEALAQSANRVGRVTLERNDEHLVLRLAGMTPVTERSNASARATEDKPRYWSVDAAGSKPLSGPSGSWDNSAFPEFADAHPGLRAGLHRAAKSIRREGPPGEVAGGLERVLGAVDGKVLYLDIDPASHIVRAAHHIGAEGASERIALDMLCLMAEDTPIQEVADHVGLRVIDALVDDDKAPPVAGVLLPSNAGSPFQVGPVMARDAYNAYRAKTGLAQTTNFYVPPPSGEWAALSTAERRGRIEVGVRAFLQSEQLYPDDMAVLRVEKSKSGHETRGVIAFSDRIEVADKPPLLRRLEQRLRRDVERQLEIVADRARDKSPLRRLS